MIDRPPPIFEDLGFDRVARLHGVMRLENVSWEISFLVGTRGGSTVPEFRLEVLNLLFLDSGEFGAGERVPSACLPGASPPGLRFHPDSDRIEGEFDLNLDIPAAELTESEEPTGNGDRFGRMPFRIRAELVGAFLSPFRHRPGEFQNLQVRVRMHLPEIAVERHALSQVVEAVELIPMQWISFRSARVLPVQPVFIAPDGPNPPTGSSFEPMLTRAIKIWGKCCIRFEVRSPTYIEDQTLRIGTQDEIQALRKKIRFRDAIEIFVIEKFDPIDLWGGGGTWNSGTAEAVIVTCDAQLPLNKNHLAHELGHVLGLDHPYSQNPGTLTLACPGTVMEPSGFYADNPTFQCRKNCRWASNPLLKFAPYRACVRRRGSFSALF